MNKQGQWAAKNINNIPQSALDAQCRIMTEGLDTHERDGWMKYSKWYSLKHIFVHLFWWFVGVKIDRASGDTHISHAYCQMAILCDNQDNGR